MHSLWQGRHGGALPLCERRLEDSPKMQIDCGRTTEGTPCLARGPRNSPRTIGDVRKYLKGPGPGLDVRTLPAETRTRQEALQALAGEASHDTFSATDSGSALLGARSSPGALPRSAAPKPRQAVARGGPWPDLEGGTRRARDTPATHASRRSRPGALRCLKTRERLPDSRNSMQETAAVSPSTPVHSLVAAHRFVRANREEQVSFEPDSRQRRKD